MAPTTPAAQAAREASETIPIVFCATADPVGDGLITSLGRPGGNATGLTTIASELSAKRLELLREVVPQIAHVGSIRYPGYAQAVRAQASTEEAARPQGVQIHAMESREGEYEVALAKMSRERMGAVILLPHPFYFRDRKQIAELALKYRLPTIYEYADYPAAGGLMSYGPSLPDNFRRAATYVDKILKGAKPADLPVEQPTKFELVINLKTAKALGLTIPQSVLARADEVIQ
jgi:putative tryptophan/tyrosine transport system substrate-binding protein